MATLVKSKIIDYLNSQKPAASQPAASQKPVAATTTSQAPPNTDKIRKAVDMMDDYTLVLANSWITGRFSVYSSSMRNDVYKWLSDPSNKDTEKYKSLIGAYVKEYLEKNLVNENKLVDIFSPFVSHDIKTCDDGIMLRESVDKTPYSIKKMNGKYYIKELKLI